MLYFNANHLPPSTPEYVAWVDVMGTQASMSTSLMVTANFIFKLHIAALQAPNVGVRIYPVMDGLYASAPTQAAMLPFLRSVFSEAGATFTAEPQERFRFVIRGGLAYGPVIHGSAVPGAASPVLEAKPGYRDQILLGMPVVQAHLAEADAPPYGINVHESARAFASAGEDPLHDRWWSWRTGATQATWANMLAALDAYYTWCAGRSRRIDYPADRIAAHRDMAQQYFL